jgi:hypothetical protein
MGVTKISQTGVGSSKIHQVDYLLERVTIGIQAVLTGTATYTVEYTLEDIAASGFDPSTVEWLPSAANLTNAVASITTPQSLPCRGIRVTVSSGTGTVDVTICQAGVG